MYFLSRNNIENTALQHDILSKLLKKVESLINKNKFY